MKQTKCHECWGLDGRHMSYCRSRGYSAVGPHPDAPQAAPPKPTVIEQCHCGIARLDCEYHRPGANADNGPATERYEVFDVVEVDLGAYGVAFDYVGAGGQMWPACIWKDLP